MSLLTAGMWIKMVFKVLPTQFIPSFYESWTSYMPLLPGAPGEVQSMARLKPGPTVFTCGLSVTTLGHPALVDVHLSIPQQPNHPTHKLHKRVGLIHDILLRQVTRNRGQEGYPQPQQVMVKPLLPPAGSRSREKTEGRTKDSYIQNQGPSNMKHQQPEQSLLSALLHRPTANDGPRPQCLKQCGQQWQQCGLWI